MNDEKMSDVLLAITEENLKMAKLIKVLGEGLAETMRQVIELKNKVEALEVKVDGI